MPAIPTSEKRPFIPAVGILQVECLYSYLSQTCENVYHVEMPGGAGAPNPADMSALAAVINAWETADMIGNRSTAAAMTNIRVRDLSVRDGLVIEHTPTGAVVGTVPGNPLPGNVTLAVKWSTGRGGRSFRGRTYHIGIPVGAVVNNTVSNAARVALTTAYSDLITRVTESGFGQLVVVSFASQKVWRETAVATPIIECSIDPNLDSQRRRLIGRGT